MRIERLLSPTTRSVAALRGRGGPTLALGRRSRAIYAGGLALFWMFALARMVVVSQEEKAGATRTPEVAIRD